MLHRVGTGALILALSIGFAPSLLQAQYNPRARQQPRGLGVSPTFEGWYPNADGTYTLSFGFFNRNTEEVVAIPVGENNFVSPGEMDQGQPTYFTPRRSYGVFTVRVPADFGRNDRVTWTLERNGERYAIPGGLIDSYETANLHAPAIDRFPPVLVMHEGGPETRGPAGERIEMSARVGEPLPLRVRAWDEHGHEVTVRWYTYRGPDGVSFSQEEIPLEQGGVEAHTTASFSQPGDYVLYTRVDHTERSVSEAGLEQCCWTNGYVNVTVSR